MSALSTFDRAALDSISHADPRLICGRDRDTIIDGLVARGLIERTPETWICFSLTDAGRIALMAEAT